MNDLVVRLRLNSTQWDTSINSAKKSLQGFEETSKKGSIEIGGLGKMFGSAGSLIGKFAGGIGVAMTAQEAFNTAINSSATLQSEYNDMIGASKESVNDFFRALTSGDWTKYNSGILDAIKNNKEFIKTRRQMGNLLQVMDISLEDVDSQKEGLEAIIEDTRNPMSMRQDSYNQLDSLLSKTIAEGKKNIELAKSEFSKEIQNAAGSNVYINSDNAKKVLLDLRNNYSSLNKELDAYLAQKKEAEDYSNPNAFKYSGDEAYQINKKQAEEFYNQYSEFERQKFDELARFRETLTDESFEAYINQLQTISSLQAQLGTFQKDLKGAADAIKEPSDEMTEAANAISTASDSLAQVNESAPQNSLAEIEQKISSLKNKLQNATSDGVRYGIQQELKKVYTLKVMMENRSKGTDLLDGSIKTQGKNPLDDINSGNLPKLNTYEGYDINKLIPNNEQLNMWDQMAVLIGETGDNLDVFSGFFEDSQQEWVKWGASALKSISGLLPYMQFMYEKIFAVAIAQSALSAAMKPVVGWALAIGATAAVAAAIKLSAPKHANGGIIGGNSFVGDNILIRANSGEMILNKRQQANLFNLLDNGYGANGNIANGNVEFRIQGKELVGVLQAYNNKASKFM